MVKRRGNNEGSITRRKDGRWQGRVSMGYCPKTGKLLRKSFYGKTRAEVQVKLTETLHAQQKGTALEPAKTMFLEWLDQWLVEYKKPRLRPLTYESYALMIRAHIGPDLGKVPLSKLQPNMLQSFYNEKLERGRKDGSGGLSSRTVRYLHTIIRQALQQAVKEGLLFRNPADATSPPTVKTKEINPLTEDELIVFQRAAEGDRFLVAYQLAAATGFRRGELLGLCWDCVNLETGQLIVRRQLLIINGSLTLDGSTKSKSGRRSVPVSESLVTMLRAHKTKQAREKLKAGSAYQDKGLVFCHTDGSPIIPAEFTRRFQRALKKAGLEKRRLHDLRHTHASLLLAKGVHPKVVQERLGHSSITMTLDLYSHLAPGMQETAAASIDSIFDTKEHAHLKIRDS